MILAATAAALIFMLLPATAGAATADVQAKLTVKQVFDVNGTDAAVAKNGAYTLTAVDAGAPMPDGAQSGKYAFSIDSTSQIQIAIAYDHAGEYIYELKQDAETAKTGYTYDQEVYKVKVYVRNDPSEQLSCEVVAERKDGSKTPELLFTNSYMPLPTKSPVMRDPGVKKIVEGNPTGAGEFEFTLTAVDKTFPMPSGSENGVKTLKIKGSGKAEFGKWSYTAAGTYKYSVAEVNTGLDGYTYDKTIYTITDIVKDEDGSLVLERSVTDQIAQAASVCTFTNTYSAGISPKTGDFFDAGLRIMIISFSVLIAVLAAIYLIMIARRKKTDEEKRYKG